jgi:hypothetical protein
MEIRIYQADATPSFQGVHMPFVEPQRPQIPAIPQRPTPQPTGLRVEMLEVLKQKLKSRKESLEAKM